MESITEKTRPRGMIDVVKFSFLTATDGRTDCHFTWPFDMFFMFKAQNILLESI